MNDRKHSATREVERLRARVFSGEMTLESVSGYSMMPGAGNRPIYVCAIARFYAWAEESVNGELSNNGQ